MQKSFLVVMLVMFCAVCAAPGSLMAGEEQGSDLPPGIMGVQALEQTKQALKQDLQSGEISREEYDIAMGDVSRNSPDGRCIVNEVIDPIRPQAA